MIRKESGASLPVAFYGITWDETVELPRDILDKHLVRAIERIDGVDVLRRDTDASVLQAPL